MKPREITAEETPTLTKLIKGILKEDFPYKERVRSFLLKEELNIEAKIKIPDFTVWAAFEEEKPIAFLIALRPFGGVTQVHWLGVSKKSRGQGIGRRLLTSYASWAKKQGAHEIDLYSLVNAVSFYKKLGFAKIALLKKHYFGVDDYLMTKTLQEPKEENFLKS